MTPPKCPPDGHCEHAEKAAEKAVKQVFAILGVNVDDAKQVEDFRVSLRFGDTMRRAADRGAMAVFLIFCTAAAVAWLAGVKLKILGP